jgi:formylglycine-generating enzyme required for sulfatase activity
MEFVYIEPGTFMMGSPSDEPYRRDNERQYEVNISKPFYLQTTEVTQGQWKKVMGNYPPELRFKECGDECPVERVSWEDAQKFISRLNQMENTDRYRLPTEAEWEYAWFLNNSDYKTHPVATKKPNTWGLYDMHGNVFEWCLDWYGKYPSGPVEDPTGPETGGERVLRGGSWNSNQNFARCADRFRLNPYYRSFNIGFRCVRTLK